MTRAATEATLTGPSPSRRLVWFVMCSAALHGLVLFVVLSTQNPERILFGEQALQVQMEKDSERHTTRSAPNVLTAPSGSHLSDAVAETRNDAVSNRAETVSPASSEPQNRQVVQNYLRGALQTELSRHLRYPLLARERGWEGTVLVRVLIAPNGALLSTRLLRSSGHALLDEASLNGLSHVRLLPMQFAARQTDPVEVVLPILFRLTDNT